MDPYIIGYYLGRITTKVVVYVTSAQLVTSGYSKVSRFANAHKIDNSDPAIISENLLNCLEYID